MASPEDRLRELGYELPPSLNRADPTSQPPVPEPWSSLPVRFLSREVN